ncbi:MAG: glycosyltransferase family 2 protein [Bacteroidia bacterium]|nr:glycosyltransferase family 2 protein [Bacteroidia bacterium]
MAFATEWLDRRALFPELISEQPDPQTGIIVVVPAYDEPEITVLLDSLSSCNNPDCRVEIIIIVNAPPGAGREILKNNTICINNIEKWKKENAGCFFRTYYYNAGEPAIRGWGAGLARKTGMDEAIRRFDSIGKPGGVIVSLDADCTVDKNYFTELCNQLLKRRDRTACSISFEHPLSGQEFADEVYKYVTMYELHMRYYYQGVRYSGYPYAFHTIGSAIAFKAEVYLKAGGMNRRQAGEDFYFVQKIVPQGGYFELDSTTVHPSPRRSGRVPFGTGAVISKLLDESVDGLLTYNPAAFRELLLLFSGIEKLFRSDEGRIIDFYNNLPAGVRSFIDPIEWITKISEIRDNTSNPDSFLKRFYGWFNMFRIVKYLNHVHPGMFEKQPVADAAYELLSIIGHHVKSKDPYELLVYYRLLERKS